MFHSTVLLIALLTNQSRFPEPNVELRITDERGVPIEGVYAQVNNSDFFTYSSEYGVLSILDKGYTDKDSIAFSHLGYISEKHSFTNLKNYPNIVMKSNIRKLDEVFVTNMSAKDYVEKSIKLLLDNFGDEFGFGDGFHSTICWTDNDSGTKLIDYKGGLVFRFDEGNRLLVGKIPEREYVTEDLGRYVYQVRPHNFISIIKIGSHPFVRKHKKYSFPKYEHISYKGVRAVKIYFELYRKYGGQSGHVIINLDDLGVMSLSYKMNPINNWIRAKTKRGMENISMDGYYVEADYSKNENGKYVFDSGMEKIALRNYAGKDKVSTTSEVHLRKVRQEMNAGKMVELKDMF